MPAIENSCQAAYALGNRRQTLNLELQGRTSSRIATGFSPGSQLVSAYASELLSHGVYQEGSAQSPGKSASMSLLWAVELKDLATCRKCQAR